MTPKTIADLKISLKFSKSSNYCPLFTDFEIELKNKNPDLVNYRIKPGIYSFRIYIPTKRKTDNSKNWYSEEIFEWVIFQIEVPKPVLQGDETYLFSFLYRINYNIYLNILNDTECCVDLDKFSREYDDFHYCIDLEIPF
jgi:hypothetical protein